jgi:predicted translin family RNA/ssDNA-binding protein
MIKKNPAPTAMNNLDGIIEKIDQRISEKEKVREDALRYSRDIIICCRKGIQQLHRNLPEAAESFRTQAYTQLQELNELTKNHPDIFNTGFVENAAQEYVELHCLANIMRGEDLQRLLGVGPHLHRQILGTAHFACRDHLHGLGDLLGAFHTLDAPADFLEVSGH